MFKSVSVHRITVLLLALTVYGAHVKGDEALGDTENLKKASSGQNAEVDTRNDSWIENLMWNLLGYATIIVPAAFIIRMLKNSNFNERSGKMFVRATCTPCTWLIHTTINSLCLIVSCFKKLQVFRTCLFNFRRRFFYVLLMNRGRSSSISQQSFLHPALFSFLFLT